MTPRARRHALALSLLAAVAATGAAAHHGWSWAEEQQTTLEGTLRSVSMAPPHPSLQVADKEGAVWQIDLGNPNQTQRSGFTAEAAKAGDAITVLGNRNLDKATKHMKAVRITVAGRTYDMYPERIRTN
ncbi:MAG TPA: DUF6152 family protein [Beijerinckiaceae bacterium]|jgi:hypothetical protein